MWFHNLLLAILLLSNDAFSYLVSKRVIRQTGNYQYFSFISLNSYSPRMNLIYSTLFNFLNPGYTSCTTPDNQPGNCVNIRNCQYMYELLTTRGREQAVVTYLRRSQCGMENNWPKVCCNSNQAIGSSTTTSPPPPVTSRTTTTTSRPTPTTPPPTQVTQRGTTVRGRPTKNYGVCGRSTRQEEKITGGRNATLGEIPLSTIAWMK